MKLFIGIPHSLKHKKKRGANQTLFVMRLIILIMALCYFRASAIANAQGISLNVKKASLESVFEQIKQQSGYSFWYRDNALDHAEKITVNIKNEGLKQTLDLCFKGQPLTYEIVEKTIVVKEKTARPSISPEKKQTDINGKVTDSAGRPLSGATVKVKSFDLSTSTNEQGLFTLKNVPDGAVLQIMYMGYRTRELTVRQSDNNLVIKMAQEVSSLQEISILSTGYQNIPLERATGSFSKVDNKTYNREVSTDIISRLKGITPSLSFDERNGSPKLAIRGRSTIYANDQPLIVIDNFPYEGDLNNINPNDIEDITILKDAAAASIWGVRAGNGVIVITTKKGKYQQPMHIDLSANVTIGERPDVFYKSKMSSSDFIEVETMLFDKGYFNTDISNTTTRPALSPVVEILLKKRNGEITTDQANAQIDVLRNYDVRNDISRYFYRQQVNQQYALNLSGGTEKHSYYLSAGLDKNLNSLSGTAFNRFQFNSQQNFKPVKGLEITSGIYLNQNETTNNSTLSSLRMGKQELYPYARLADEDGNHLATPYYFRQSFVNTLPAQGFLNWNYLPLDELQSSDSHNQLTGTRLSIGLNYKLVEGLTADIKYQYENQSDQNHNLYSQDNYYTRDLINKFSSLSGTTVTRNIPLGAIVDDNWGKLNAHNGRFQLNYINNFSKHSVAGLAGYEVRQIRTTGNASRLYGYDETTGSSVPVNYTTSFSQYPSGNATIQANDYVTGTLDRFRSYFANVSYTYNERYTVSGSGRIDQSNLFGVAANQRSVPLWSAGVKWNIGREDFFRLGWVNQLQLRASYGYEGNLDKTATAFTTALLTTNSVTRSAAARITNPPNSELRWERSAIFNVGTDFSFLKNRISGSVEYFHKRGIDLIGNGPIDPTTGFVQFRGNLADMVTKGYDINLSTVNVNHQFKWTTNYLFSYALDKVLDYFVKPTLTDFTQDYSIFRTSAAPVSNRPLYGIYSYPWAGLDPATGAPRGYLNGQVSNNYSAITTYLASDPANNLMYMGPALAPYFGSLRNTFAYKGWEASVNITYKFGYYFRRQSILYNSLYSTYNINGDFSGRWQNPGDEATTNVPAMVYPANVSADSYYQNSAVLVEKGDHVRIQDINLSYSMPKSVTDRLKINNLTLFAYANNLGIVWSANKYHIDPDFPNTKPIRTIAFGLKSKF